MLLVEDNEFDSTFSEAVESDDNAEDRSACLRRRRSCCFRLSPETNDDDGDLLVCCSDRDEKDNADDDGRFLDAAVSGSDSCDLNNLDVEDGEVENA